MRLAARPCVLMLAVVVLTTRDAGAQGTSGAATPAPATATHEPLRVGGVFDLATGTPIADAEIAVLPDLLTARTSADGLFGVRLAPGNYLLRVRQLGYRQLVLPVRASLADTVPLTLVMERSAAALDTVRVIANADDRRLSLVGFDDRKRAGRSPPSAFMTREDFEFRRPEKTRDMLAFTSVRCGSAVIFLDGSPLTYDVAAGSLKRITKPGDLVALDVIRPDDVLAMEVYHKNVAPAQFSTFERVECIVVLWTR